MRTPRAQATRGRTWRGCRGSVPDPTRARGCGCTAHTQRRYGAAGAGTILESLRAGKSLIVVTNETLMDNHQAEIAGEVARRGYAVHCTPGYLVAALGGSELDALHPYPDADPGQLVQTLNAL